MVSLYDFPSHPSYPPAWHVLRSMKQLPNFIGQGEDDLREKTFSNSSESLRRNELRDRSDQPLLLRHDSRSALALSASGEPIESRIARAALTRVMASGTRPRERTARAALQRAWASVS